MSTLPATRPRIEVWAATHDAGAVDLAPWLAKVTWGASIEGNTPPVTLSFVDPRRAVSGSPIDARVKGTPEQTQRWAREPLSDVLRCGDWIVIKTQRGGRGLELAAVGIVESRPSACAIGDDGAPQWRFDVAAQPLATALLDWELLVDHRFEGMPSFFNVHASAITVAMAAGTPGPLLAAVLREAVAGGAVAPTAATLTYPRAPALPPEAAVWLDLATEVGGSGAIDGAVIDGGLSIISPQEVRTVRQIVSPYLGLPALAEMFVEPRNGALTLVYREHPWDRDDWEALPALSVDWTGGSLVQGSGAVFNRIMLRPEQIAGGSGFEWGALGSSPYCPILDVETMRRFGVRRFEPSVRWGDSPRGGLNAAAAQAWIERWNLRLWAWHALGNDYLAGTIQTRYRPDVLAGSRVSCRVPGRGEASFHFYVEGYTHEVTVNPSNGSVESVTNLAVTRGQRGADGGAYAVPPAPPRTVLRSAEGGAP